MPTEPADGLYWLDFGMVNAYLVEDGDDLVLCDAGTPGSVGSTRDGITAAGHEVGEIDRILLTHYDYDHVGGLANLAADLDAPVFAADPDASYLAGESKPPLTNHKGLIQRAMGFRLSAPDLPVERVADGDALGSFTAYHTPGHTPGHLAFVSESLGVGLLGDLVREDGGELSASPWFLSYDTGEVGTSIRRLAADAPDFAVACPGHGDPITAGGLDALIRIE